MKRLYSLLLSLFPREYREEYSEELQAVFNRSIDDAIKIGWLEILIVVSREMAGLPGAILHEHLRRMRKARMKKGFYSYFDFAGGSWNEFLVSLFPFFLAGGVMPLISYLGRARVVSGTAGTVIGLFSLGLFLVLLMIGGKRGMPRWSLPYLGFFLGILSLYFFSAVFGTPIYLLFRNLRDQSILVIDILWDGIFWYGLLFSIFLITAISRVSPAFQHFKKDWTLPCFILYGAVPFAVWITFDEYLGDEPYTLLAFLVLSGGAWLYLRSANEWTRFGALFVALTIAIFIAAIGKVLLIPSQTWPITLDGGLARSEFRHTVTMWGWFVLGMLLPLVNRSFSHPDHSGRATLSDG